MAKNALREYSTTPGSNTDVGGIGIEGTNQVSNFDGAVREIMSQIADTNAGTSPLDDTFSVCDPADTTKKVRMDAGNVAAGQTRVLKFPNADIDISTFATTYLLKGTAAETATALSVLPLSGGKLTGTLTIENNAPIIELSETDVGAKWFIVVDGPALNIRYADLGTILMDLQPDGTWTWFGNKVFHAGNDGTGSGMDTDLIRGEAPTASFKSVVSALIPTPPAGRIRIVGKADTGGASLGYVELDKATGNFISFTAF